MAAFRCTRACTTWTTPSGWRRYVDDDAYGHVDRWFAATLSGTCPACGIRNERAARLVSADGPTVSWDRP
ncbi:MAG TPA: hypothetical protein VK659_09460 [Asanoa sp.]|nr:hypothetical protein [Asanoa sp.]